mmetsp:Transcript_11876/g.32557  ORF Transcript_11876/g.32557 Transcript_11876/m.32557 type:complete len:217 (+) Transcript_11876:1557-2207(+)
MARALTSGDPRTNTSLAGTRSKPLLATSPAHERTLPALIEAPAGRPTSLGCASGPLVLVPWPRRTATFTKATPAPFDTSTRACCNENPWTEVRPLKKSREPTAQDCSDLLPGSGKEGRPNRGVRLALNHCRLATPHRKRDSCVLASSRPLTTPPERATQGCNSWHPGSGREDMLPNRARHLVVDRCKLGSPHCKPIFAEARCFAWLVETLQKWRLS